MNYSKLQSNNTAMRLFIKKLLMLSEDAHIALYNDNNTSNNYIDICAFVYDTSLDVNIKIDNDMNIRVLNLDTHKLIEFRNEDEIKKILEDALNG